MLLFLHGMRSYGFIPGAKENQDGLGRTPWIPGYIRNRNKPRRTTGYIIYI